MQAPNIYPHEAFAFAESVDQARDADEVVCKMRRVLGSFGLSYFGIAALPRGREVFDDLLVAAVAPPEWVGLYTARQYVKSDPVISRLRQSIMPFEWRAAASANDRDAPAADVMESRLEFGIRAGICVPIPRRRGMGFAAMSGDYADLDPRAKPLVHLVAIHALDRIHALAKPGRAATVLTEREREVLTWIAAGKSAWEIGQILSIAKRTVDEHAQTAARKLGAVNRAQAVAIALRDRVIAI